MSSYRALLLKEVNIVYKWLLPSSPLNSLDELPAGQTQRKTCIMTGINQDVYTVSNTEEPAVREQFRTDQ